MPKWLKILLTVHNARTLNANSHQTTGQLHNGQWHNGQWHKRTTLATAYPSLSSKRISAI